MSDLKLRQLAEHEIDLAEQLNKRAFRTFTGIPEKLLPVNRYVLPRFRTDPTAAIAAELNGELVGITFALGEGSVARLGPIAVKPGIWKGRIGTRMVEAAHEIFDQRWKAKTAILFTFPNSPLHFSWFSGMGYRPRYLTAVCAGPVPAEGPTPGHALFSALPEADRRAALAATRELTERIHPGLDLSVEISATQVHGFGETVLLGDPARPRGVAVCQVGADTEAGAGNCFIRFGGVAPGASAGADFEELLDACLAYARGRGLTHVGGGFNTGRTGAWGAAVRRRWRPHTLGIAMYRPDSNGYDSEQTWVIEDAR